jgi:hypothetical protein
VITIELGEEVSILLQVENKEKGQPTEINTKQNLPEFSSGSFSSYFVYGKSHFRISATIHTVMTEVLCGLGSENRNKSSDKSDETPT